MKNNILLPLFLVMFTITIKAQNFCDKIRDSIQLSYTNKPFVGKMTILQKDDTIMFAQIDQQGNMLIQRTVEDRTVLPLHEETFFDARLKRYQTRSFRPKENTEKNWEDGKGDLDYEKFLTINWHSVNRLTKETQCHCGATTINKEELYALTFDEKTKKWFNVVGLTDTTWGLDINVLYRQKNFTLAGVIVSTYTTDMKAFEHKEFQISWEYDNKTLLYFSSLGSKMTFLYKPHQLGSRFRNRSVFGSGRN